MNVCEAVEMKFTLPVGILADIWDCILKLAIIGGMYLEAIGESEAMEAQSRSIIPDAAFSLKLLAPIGQLFSGLVNTIAGTGRGPRGQSNSKNLMDHVQGRNILNITSPDGWVFAFEGGAHILFRHTTSDQRFV